MAPSQASTIAKVRSTGAVADFRMLADMAETGAPVTVRDDPAARRLVVEIDGIEGFLQYATEPGRLILVHTEVPEALGGHGVGTALVQAALARARAEGLTVVPWCPFARNWMRKHMDALDGLSVDWKTPPPSGDQ